MPITRLRSKRIKKYKQERTENHFGELYDGVYVMDRKHFLEAMELDVDSSKKSGRERYKEENEDSGWWPF